GLSERTERAGRPPARRRPRPARHRDGPHRGRQRTRRQGQHHRGRDSVSGVCGARTGNGEEWQPMPSYPEFQLEVAQNQYLAPGATEVNAVLTVTADAPEEGQFTTSAAEIVIVDCSASMYRPSKLNAAKQATIAAIDGIRDGVEFAV